MIKRANQNEQGQNLVIFAVLMIVLIALAGLVIDGGFGLLKRRQAQNAADAGALAGGVILCRGGTEAEASSEAIDYSGRNGAAVPTPVISFGDSGISVTTTIPHPTFLARIFGADVISATAIASAGCFVPCNITGVLPVAWLCRDIPLPGEPVGEGCGIDYHDLNDPPPPDNELIVIMDSLKTGQDVCKDSTGYPSYGLNCDTNGDGANEVKMDGDRSWLDLDGSGGGSSQLVDWVLNGYGGEMSTHHWYAGQTGVANDVFQAVGDIVGDIVLLPVFDEVPCNGLPNINCPTLWHSQDDTIASSGASQMYYHVITFSAFLITCVEAPGVPGNPDCPGKNLAQSLNEGVIPENTKSIEGYFVYYNFGTGACTGPDAGVHTIYLNK